MRIESYFTDYYDKIQALGMDQSCVYKRKTKIASEGGEASFGRLLYHNNCVNIWNFEARHKYLRGWESLQCRQFVIGYCGRLFRGFQFMFYEYDGYYSEGLFYNPKEVLSLAEKRQNKYRIKDSFFEQIHDMNDDPEYKRLESFPGSEVFPEEIVRNVFNIFQVPLFIYNIVGVYKINTFDPRRYDRGEVILNPCLEKINFHEIKNAKTCYQEIYQFLSSGFEKGVSMDTPMSELDKVNQHGFDPKYSFRNRPGHKKRKKRRKRKK